MWEFMSRTPGAFQKTTVDGKNAVEKGDGSYAFLMVNIEIIV
jgi:hypothetical protein